MLLRYSGASRTTTPNWRSASNSVVAVRAAQCGLNDVVDVVDAQAVARRLGAIDPDIQIRLSEHPEYAEIGNAPHFRHFAHRCSRELLQGREIGTDDLD